MQKTMTNKEYQAYVEKRLPIQKQGEMYLELF